MENLRKDQLIEMQTKESTDCLRILTSRIASTLLFLCLIAGLPNRSSFGTDKWDGISSENQDKNKSGKRRKRSKQRTAHKGKTQVASIEANAPTNTLPSSTPETKPSIDERLRALLSEQGISPLDAGPIIPPAQIRLGQALFFDRELSGNRDTSCATCHHPSLGTSDGIALSVGTSPETPNRLGPERQTGTPGIFAPRNAPAIFNLGSRDWRTQYWDARIALREGQFVSPAGHALPRGFPNVVAVQAMFPVTSRVEMRGSEGDLDIHGNHNELADIADTDFKGIWGAVAARLESIPEYRTMFAEAFPNENISFQNAAIAIAAFEAEAYTFLDSPWDRYVAGDNRAISSRQKTGALLFFGKALCSNCHSGPLLTDQEFHNIGVAQFGPGKGEEAPLDHGRGRETGIHDDYFRFRTPPLRNCEVTGPYMHNGAYMELEDAIEHHVNPNYLLDRYEVEDYVDQEQVGSFYHVESSPLLHETIDLPRLPTKLSKKETQHIVNFLETLTAPNIRSRLEATIPTSVPSGLVVETVSY